MKTIDGSTEILIQQARALAIAAQGSTLSALESHSLEGDASSACWVAYTLGDVLLKQLDLIEEAIVKDDGSDAAPEVAA